MTYFSRNNPEFMPTSEPKKYRAKLQGTKQFLHAGGDSLTSNEAFAWFGNENQFKRLKASKEPVGIWAPGNKWILTRRSGFSKKAPPRSAQAL
jgi:hypothetical protein